MVDDTLKKIYMVSGKYIPEKRYIVQMDQDITSKHINVFESF